jgi:outer membrane protein TolC
MGDTMPGMDLDSCIARALQANSGLKRAEEKTIEGDAMVREARAGFLPQLSASAGYSYLDEQPTMTLPEMMPGAGEATVTMGNANSANAMVSLSQPLFTGGKLLNGYQMARHNRESIIQESRAAKKDLVRDVTKAYYSVLTARRSLVALESSIKLMEQIVTDLSNAVEVGMRGEHELLQAKVQLLNQQLAQRRARNGVKATEGRLATLLGLPLDHQLPLEDTIPEPTQPLEISRENLLLRARTELPEIKAMESRLASVQALERLTAGQYLPNLVAAAAYNGQTQGIDELSWQDNMVLSLNAQWNIFDWGAAHQKKLQVRSQKRQLELAIEELRSNMEFMTRTNVLALEEAREAIEISRLSVDQSRRSYAVTYDQFAEGLVPNSDVLNAQTVRLQSELAYFQALSDYHAKRADLEYLLDLVQ